MYAVYLPPACPLPERLRVKFFKCHDTFAAYLGIWDEANFVITWDSATVARIWSRDQ